MQHEAPSPLAALPLARDLLALMERMRERLEEDPFGNPVLSVALAISRRIDTGALPTAELETLVRFLRDAAFAGRAERLAGYVGVDDDANTNALTTLAARLVRPDPADSPVPFAAFRAAIERPRFSPVFTAHPTFAIAPEVAAALAEAASGRRGDICFVSHRPAPITLGEEFDRAVAAMAHGRDALDRLTEALLTAARRAWPGRWTELVPKPVTLASWVGYDTDGRTDIHWWDTLRLRLRMKRLHLARLGQQVQSAPAVQTLLTQALAAVDAQLACCPAAADPDAVAAFAHALVEQHAAALVDPETLTAAFAAAFADAADPRPLAVARAGFLAHGMSLAHTQVRLNSAQLHNVVRQRLGFADPPEDPSRRRVLLTAINAALDDVQPVPVDFGALLETAAQRSRSYF